MKNNRIEKLLFITFLLIVFLGVSGDFGMKFIPKPYSLNSGEKELVVRVELSGLKPVFAASTNWSAVRDVTTFGKNVVKGIDSIIQQLATNSELELKGA